MSAASQDAPVEPEDVARVVARALGCRVLTVQPVTGSLTNENHLVSTPTGEVVLKSGAAGDMRAEAWACQRVRSVGIAAPEVLALDTGGGDLGRPYLVTRRVAGRAAGQDAPALVEAGRQLAVLHSLPADGYGFLRENALDRPVDAGPRTAWAEVFTGALDELASLVDAGVLRVGTADRLHAVVDRHPSSREAPPGVLLHGDLHPRHVFSVGDRLTGIIDWGDVAAGDPLFDLGRFSMAGRGPLEALLLGYSGDAALDAATEAALTSYRVLWAMLALVYEFRAGGDWFASYVEVLEAGLAELDC